MVVEGVNTVLLAAFRVSKSVVIFPSQRLRKAEEPALIHFLAVNPVARRQSCSCKRRYGVPLAACGGGTGVGLQFEPTFAGPRKLAILYEYW